MTDSTNNSLDMSGTGDDVSDIMDTLPDDVFDDDPETDTDDNTSSDADEADDSDTEGEDSSDPDDVDDEEADAEDSDDDEADEDTAGPGRLRDEKGRFVSDEQRVQLDDGTTATIAELKAGALRQSDYTRKTQELSEGRTALEGDRQRVSQLEQQLDQQIALVGNVLEAFKPQVPQDPTQLDAYHAYRQQWEQLNQQLESASKERTEKAEADKQAEAQSVLQRETERLYAAIPTLRDPARRQAFFGDIMSGSSKFYGMSEQDIASISDHRAILVLQDALAFRRLKEKREAAKQTVEKAPRLNKGGKRTGTKTTDRRSRQARTDRLKREGSIAAGVSSLMDLDL